jgi:hypothetical protein
MNDQVFIQSVLELWKADRSFVRENTDNPICSGCNRREERHLIEYEISDPATPYQVKLVCAECADDHLQSLTGCRFGMRNCVHPDCKL